MCKPGTVAKRVRSSVDPVPRSRGTLEASGIFRIARENAALEVRR